MRFPFHANKLWQVLTAVCIALVVASCVGDPAKVDVKLPEATPEMKVTSYSQALTDLGLMTEIYATGQLKIQSQGIGDETGTSGSTGGEIQRDITEMVKSTLNSIGGGVIFIEYDPAYIQNQMVTGYSNFEQKLVPDVVVTGGITEFDRGLETRGSGTDVAAEAEFSGLGSALPSKSVGFEWGESGKQGTARITLDFNLKNFKTLAGIPRMNTVNTMVVSKAMANEEFGITLFGPTFGRKGSIKKVQGRHNAVRVLVQMSMVQMVGKYLVLPYWRVLGEDAQPDPVVMSALAKSYYRMPDTDRIRNAQEWLILHGYEVPITGRLDDSTRAALQAFHPGFDPAAQTIDKETFSDLYLGIPIDESTLGRRQLIARAYQQGTSAAFTAAPRKQQPAPKPAAQRAPAPSSAAPPKAAAPAPQPPPSGKGALGGIGRMLTEEEW